MAEQLPFDFSASVSVRHRRATKMALLAAQPTLFAYAPNLDIHLHSSHEAVANVTGIEPERASVWLTRLVGPIRENGPRRLMFPASRLDRLLHVRPPAQVTLDASSAAVARALWASKLGLRPLQVSRIRQRLIASSKRWPTGFGISDAPWPAIATIMALDLPLNIDPRAQALMTSKLAETGAPIGSAGLAGSAVIIETARPTLLEALGLPALAYMGAPGSGRYRMPLLAAECLLTESSITLSDDLRTAIKATTGKVRPLATGPGFPWNLYAFQARDAARAVRILETTGGVLLAGDMGSGKGGRPADRILTPTGWTTYGHVAVGDRVVGANGRPTTVTGVFRRGTLPVFRVHLSDGVSVVCDDDHLWAVRTTPASTTGRPVQVLSLRALRAELYDAAGAPRFHIPLVAPVAFEPAAPLPGDPYLLATRLVPAPVPSPSDRPCPPSEGRIPSEYLFAIVTDRIALLQGLLDTHDVMLGPPSGSLDCTVTSVGLAADVCFLVEGLGGTARVTKRVSGATPPTWHLSVVVPFAISAALRLPGGVSLSRDASTAPQRAIVAVEPVGDAEVICIAVDAADHLYVGDHAVVTHNTTVSLAVADHLDMWPLLVVAPLAAYSTWSRHLAEMNKSYFVVSGHPAKAWAAIETAAFDAIVISYDRLLAFTELIERYGFVGIIADELQRVRTASSRRSRALRQLASLVPRRIGLSGTPMQNRIEDLLAPGAFLVPGEWPPRASTKDLADIYAGDPIEAVADHLGSMMVRRRIDETGVKMPGRVVRRVHVELTPEQRRALADLDAEAKAAAEEGDLGTRMHVFTRLQKMRKIIACPAAVGVGGPNPKVQTAIELVEGFSEMGRKCVVFAADRKAWLETGAALDDLGIGWTGIWGSTPPDQRVANEKAFHEDANIRVFVGTIQSCAEALTLSPTGTVVVFLSTTYNPMDLAQAEARVYRMNQTNDVEIIYLHATAPGGTLDDRMAEILDLKRELFAKVVDRRTHSDDTQVHYSLGDLVFLLTGKRDAKIDMVDKDRKAVTAREQAAKQHARATAHAHKTGEFLDDGKFADLLDDEDFGDAAITAEAITIEDLATGTVAEDLFDADDDDDDDDANERP